METYSLNSQLINNTRKWKYHILIDHKYIVKMLWKGNRPTLSIIGWGYV